MSNTQPQNTNTLQTSKFQLSFVRLPGIVYFCQSVNLPGVSLGEAAQETPFVTLWRAGDKLQYDTFNVTFLLDEDMRAWFGIHDWMRGLGFPESFEEYKQLKDRKKILEGLYSDATLTIHNNSNVPQFRVLLKDCFPTSLSSFQFDSTIDAQIAPISDAVFRFSYHQIVRI